MKWPYYNLILFRCGEEILFDFDVVDNKSYNRSLA